LGVTCVSTAVAALEVRDYVTSDPKFVLSSERKDAFQVQGVRYAPRAKVWRVFQQDFGRSIFSIPLAERRRSLLAIDWVEDVSISRVWPDRLLVRIRERKPVAFVAIRSGAMLIDADGVLLDPPSGSQFTFPVLSGLSDDEPEERRRPRVRAFLRCENEMGAAMKDISEIDVSDPNDLRLVARVDDRALDLRIGDRDFAGRYKRFLAHYPEIQKRSPEVAIFDLRQDDRITAKE
jgi:cell division protein FtsQ